MKAGRSISLGVMLVVVGSGLAAAVAKPGVRAAADPRSERAESGTIETRLFLVGGVAVIALIGGLVLVTPDGSRASAGRVSARFR